MISSGRLRFRGGGFMGNGDAVPPPGEGNADGPEEYEGFLKTLPSIAETMMVGFGRPTVFERAIELGTLRIDKKK